MEGIGSHRRGISSVEGGEPVPQKLLDRVLVDDAYWSHQQRFKLSAPT